MSVSFKVEFEGFDAFLSLLSEVEGELERALEDALLETHGIITPLAEAAIAPHKRTGRTSDALYRDARVQWVSNTKAQIDVGFAIHLGGLASIFLTWGTPRMAADKAFYQAFFGQDMAIYNAQKKAFQRVAFQRLMG